MFFQMLICTLVFSLSSADPGSSLPNGQVWGCLPGNVSSHLPFCDVTLPINQRISDLVDRLTVDEMVALLCADNHTHVNSCNMVRLLCLAPFRTNAQRRAHFAQMSAGCPRFGIPPYMHLVETNTAVASTCLAPGKCSTNYPGPTGLGATFNRTLWRK
jgi:hypothetical protein